MRAYAVATRSLPFFILIAALLAPGGDARAQSTGDVRVFYWVDNDVGSQYVASVMITNMTDADIPMWNLEFDLDPPATGIREASFELSGVRHKVGGRSWNKAIPSGESVWFHIDGYWYGESIPPPTNCEFNGAACTFEGADPAEPEPLEESPVDVAYWVAEEGVSEYVSHILLRNRTHEPVVDWTMGFDSPSLITRMEHAEYTRSDIRYQVTPKPWTREIEPGELIWYSFEGVHYGKVDSLSACVFDGFDCEFLSVEELLTDAEEEAEEFELGECLIPASEVPPVPIEDIDIQVDIQLWPTGYTLAIEITNNGEHALRGWELEFDLPLYQTVEDLWNAQWERNGTTITIRNEIYSACVEPGNSVIVGMQGQHDGRADKPTGCLFGGDSCVFGRFLPALSTDNEAAPTLPSAGFEIGLPYPNPASGSARIPFRVDETQAVEMALYDLQGRRVASFYQGTALAGAISEATVSTAGLPAGPYFVRLSGERGASIARPLVLVR